MAHSAISDTRREIRPAVLKSVLTVSAGSLPRVPVP